MDNSIEIISRAKERKSRPMPALKKKRLINRTVRAAVQVFFFFAAPAIFTTSFSGIRYIVTQLAGHETLELSVFLKTVIAMLLYTIVFGRFLCGYACAFGSVQDGLYGLVAACRKKAGKSTKQKSAPADRYLAYIKYFILIAIILLCFFGGFTKLQIFSPWNAFSQITSRQFRFQGLAASALLLAAVLAASCIKQRFFCRFLCPMGAVFALMPVLPSGRLYKDRENCIRGCSACKNNCPAGLDLAKDAASCGECIGCGACQDICPKQNIGIGLGRKIKGNEIFCVIIKAAVLYAVYFAVTKSV